MLIMLIRRRKRASNNVWPARPHGDLSQRRLFTFSATKGEYVIHVHCIYINIAPLPLNTYSQKATADNADLLELGQGPTVTVVIPLFCHLLLTGFPLIISEVAAPTCRQLSLRLMATDRKNVPAKLAPTDSPILPPNERYLKEVPVEFTQSFHH